MTNTIFWLCLFFLFCGFYLIDRIAESVQPNKEPYKADFTPYTGIPERQVEPVEGTPKSFAWSGQLGDKVCEIEYEEL
jgi:hypothetical protein